MVPRVRAGLSDLAAGFGFFSVEPVAAERFDVGERGGEAVVIGESGELPHARSEGEAFVTERCEFGGGEESDDDFGRGRRSGVGVARDALKDARAWAR